MITVRCTQCGSPTGLHFSDALSFDTEWVRCEECKPRVRKPRVHLYGLPDGQELQRWSDATYELREVAGS